MKRHPALVPFSHDYHLALAGRLAAQVEAGAPEAELRAELGGLLEEHIRFEERQLFPLIERLLSLGAPAAPPLQIAPVSPARPDATGA